MLTDANPFAGIGSPAIGPTLGTRLRRSNVSAACFRIDDPGAVTTHALPGSDAFLLVLHRGREPPGAEAAASGWGKGRTRMNIFDLSPAPSCRLVGSFASVHCHVPRAALEDLSEDAGAPAITRLRAPGGWDTVDPVVEGLLGALVPAMERPDVGHQLCVDHVLLALHAHLARTYGGLRVADQRAGLAPWQNRRAKELMAERLVAPVTVAELARACDLSSSHFSRAFKRTNGCTPHVWLQTRRIELAQRLLRGRQSTLAGTASACGFADQSHFTRTFTRFVGCTPGLWKRQHEAR